MPNDTRSLVNPVSLIHCCLRVENQEIALRDLSFLRVVTDKSPLEIEVGKPLDVEVKLDRQPVAATVVLQSVGGDFLRFSFSRLVPSGQAMLRSFLSARKIGESLIQDWRTEPRRHFHGLNESELWVGTDNEVLFSCLDQASGNQFVLHISERLGIRAGKLSRDEYMAIESIDATLPLKTAPTDRDTYLKMGECRDILTNFRPITQVDYVLKARLLKAISDHLYSTSHRVEWTPIRPRSSSSATIELT